MIDRQIPSPYITEDVCLAQEWCFISKMKSGIGSKLALRKIISDIY